MTPEEFGQLAIQHGGIAGSTLVNTTIKRTYGGTVIEEENPNPPRKYVFNDGTTITVQRDMDPQTGMYGDFQVIDPGTALKTTQQQGSEGHWYQGQRIEKDPTTGEYRVVYDANQAAASQPQFLNSDTSDPYILQMMPDGTIKQIPNPNYRPPTGPTRAPRYPEEEELARLNVEKARRELMNPYALAMQQQEEAIAAIQQKLAAGQITPQEADRQMQLIKANINATLMGTSPWQMRQQQQNLASDVLTNRMTTGSSLASSLLSGAGNIYGRILSGHGAPTGFNPLAMAQGFVQEMGGGPELTALAKAILTGALQQSAQGGW